MTFVRRKARADRTRRRKCSEKDTARNKPLQCDGHFRRDVTYFAARLSNAMGNWHFRMQAASKQSFQLFYFYETAQQTASIFPKLPMNVPFER
jgi:hypothetical protein